MKSDSNQMAILWHCCELSIGVALNVLRIAPACNWGEQAIIELSCQ